MTHRPFSLFFQANPDPFPCERSSHSGPYRNPASQPTRRLPFTNGIEGDNSREVKENDRIRKSLKTNSRKCLNCSQGHQEISKPRKQNRQNPVGADPESIRRIYCALLNSSRDELAYPKTVTWRATGQHGRAAADREEQAQSA
ncbi:hypothetical protein ACFSQT_00120 [Mesorhizobium calcicola]|uniref:Uncharacterized protein n=1 Tax=Mesorhizobium calcicola TaxID=1300310 RepID=A0ABW4W5M5_9HYPH